MAAALDLPRRRNAVVIARVNADDPPASASQCFLQGQEVRLRHPHDFCYQTVSSAAGSRGKRC